MRRSSWQYIMIASANSPINTSLFRRAIFRLWASRFPTGLGILALLASVSLSIGCGSQADNRVKYAVTAQQNYEKGAQKLKTKAWQGAAKYFAFIKARFPYSKYAVLAELRMADAEFGAENYLQAVDGFKLFAKFHPTHDMVLNGYAAYRVGEAYYKMLPGSWWLLPPAREKDQSATADAHRQLTTFIKKYPKSPYHGKAVKRLTSINTRLAQHEMYVAEYYWDRNKPMGTVLRLRSLLAKHRGTNYDAPALYLLGQAYVKVKMLDRAKETWNDLIKTHPKHAKAKDARAAVRTL